MASRRDEEARRGVIGALAGALVLAGVGFAVGLILGVVSEEPQLVLGHLGGRSTEVAWRDASDFGSVDPPVELAVVPPEDAEAARPAMPAVAAAPPAELRARPESPAPGPPPRSNAPAAAVVGTGFAVQVGAFANEQAADELRGRLRDRGFDAYLTPSAGVADGRWRVRVGPVADRAQADALAKRLERDEKLPTWVLSEEGA